MIRDSHPSAMRRCVTTPNTPASATDLPPATPLLAAWPKTVRQGTVDLLAHSAGRVHG